MAYPISAATDTCRRGEGGGAGHPGSPCSRPGIKDWSWGGATGGTIGH